MDALRDLLSRDVVAAAPGLLGYDLVFGALRGRIVETEAYRVDDPACHAYGKTKMKNMVMFGPPGHAYVYFNYGVHWMLNVSAHAAGDPAAVLIRAVRPLAGLDVLRDRRPGIGDVELTNGPGKLCRAFGITDAQNGMDLLNLSSPLHLEPGEPVSEIWSGPRVGIAKGKGHETPWRFITRAESEWSSRPRAR